MFQKVWMAVGLATGIGLTASTAIAETQLNMGGSSTSSGFFPYYSAIANGISRDSDELNVTVVSPGGFAKNQGLLREGDLDFGGISPDLIQSAIDDGYDGFRVLWWSLAARQNMMATKESGISNIADFDGKCFHPGMNGSSGQKNMLKILKALNIQPNLHMSDRKDAINAIKNGRCLGQMKATTSGRLDGASAELNLTTPLQGVGYTPEQIDAIKKDIPWMGFVEMPGLDGEDPYKVHAIWIGFTATDRMDADTAYAVTKGMVASLDDQRAALKALKGVDIIQQTLDVSEYPLHEGAVRFYREQGNTVPDRLLPPELR